MIEDWLEEIAYALRMGNAAAADAALTEISRYEFSIARGRARADRRLKRDAPLPPAEPLKIGAGQPTLPSIYPESPFRTPRKRAAA